MRWANDYGDVPRWYWNSTAFQVPRQIDYRRRYWRGRAALASVLVLAGSV